MPYFLTLLFFCAIPLSAKDFGNFGITFPVLEDDFIMMLQDRLKKVSQEGKAPSIAITNPKGKKLPMANYFRLFEYNPEFCLEKDLLDHNGSLIYPKGTRINPLDFTPLSTDLLFFDGENKRQVLWAKHQTGMWILANGNPLEIEKQEDRPVYFDQTGYLIDKLGIKALPAKVTQCGKKLTVEEIPCF